MGAGSEPGSETESDQLVPAPLTSIYDRLAGKIVLIAGASSGLGETAARRFAAEGAHVVVAARRADRLEALVSDLTAQGLEASFVTCDVTDEGTVERALATVIERHGRLDGALNSAGILGQSGRLDEMDAEVFARVHQVNVKGTFLLLKHEIRAMSATGGAIVNITSSLGLIAYAKMTDYTSSKAAIHDMTKSAAMAYGRRGIRVNAIAPGGFFSEMLVDDAAERERMAVVARATPIPLVGQPDDMARAALFLLSDEARWITGALLPVDGGTSAGKPRWV
jgi:A-factor type gamma-butyrolactone 1'-reductase (1S-forming)